MSVWEYLKRNISDYFYAIAFVLAVSFALSQNMTAAVSVRNAVNSPVIILDPGHGGLDGGTKTADGVLESTINLQVSLRLQDLMKLLGMDCVMNRSADISLDTQGESVREKKNSDLRNRVKMVNESENGILISVHQNHFTQSQYAGPQVFYSDSEESKVFAELMQNQMNGTLAPTSNRVCKAAQGVYLMEHINKTGILVECGFLSNPQEASKLQTPEYQKNLACVIVSTAAQYIQNRGIG